MNSGLKSILRQPLNPDDVRDIIAEMDNDGPRGAAVLGGVLVEETLRLLLLSQMVKLSRNEADSLFSPMGPLSSFSAKIAVGYAFRCYGPLTRDDLNTVRDVRNAFAHARRLINFDTKEVTQHCARLHCASSVAPATTRETFTMGVKLCPESAMADGLLHDLPRDLPTFLERFGTDEQCRAYLVRARWPAGFGCTGCGHDQAYSHKKRLIEECTACGKQHSILAGTIFEQTKTGLARWFLAIYLVTSSKGGMSAMELPAADGLWQLWDGLGVAAQDPPRHGRAGAPAARRARRGRRDPGRRRATWQARPRRCGQDFFIARTVCQVAPRKSIFAA